EQHRDETALCGRLPTRTYRRLSLRRSGRGHLVNERRAALIAEPHRGLVRRAARGADTRKSRAAPAAKARARRILGSATRARGHVREGNPQPAPLRAGRAGLPHCSSTRLAFAIPRLMKYAELSTVHAHAKPCASKRSL